MVQFKNVSKQFPNGVVALEDVSFTIDEGEFVFLIGPSGSGKTTMIEMLIRDQVPTSGQIYLDDKDITDITRNTVYKLRRQIGVIFQDFKLVPDKTAYENVAFAMEAAGKTNDEIDETVPYLLEIVGLDHRMKAFPHQLSGGEQQRVAIARAIANNPRILIADEPTGNLDPASAWDIVQILTKINNWGTTIIMSTHETDIVNSLNKRVIQMQAGKILRDDNNGGYEFYSDEVLKQKEDLTEKIDKEDEVPEKKKKTIKVNLTEQVSYKVQPVSDPPVEEPKKGLFSFAKNLFGRKKRDIEIFEDNNEDEEQMDAVEEELATPKVQIEEPKVEVTAEEKIEEKEEDKSFEEKLLEHLDKEEEKTNNEERKTKDGKKQTVPSGRQEAKSKKEAEVVVEENDVEVEVDETEVEDEVVEVKEEESKKSNSTKTLKGLTQNIDSSKKDSKEAVKEDNQLENVLSKTDKKSVKLLHLPKEVIADLVSAGYNYIGQVIDDGPEKLSAHKILDADEIILIAKAIDKYIKNLK